MVRITCCGTHLVANNQITLHDIGMMNVLFGLLSHSNEIILSRTLTVLSNMISVHGANEKSCIISLGNDCVVS